MNVKALRKVYSLRHNLLEHGLVFHVLGHRAYAEVTAQRDNASYQRPILFAVLHPQDEIALDLEEVDRETLDVTAVRLNEGANR